MNLKFYKYQGTGNDFVVIDDRKNMYSLSSKQIKNICSRNFGVGADGLIILKNDENYDFSMKYYNSDGNESTMCGNGGRCIVAFASYLKIISDKTKFKAIDGVHEAIVLKNNNIRLKMNDVNNIEIADSTYYLDTGSPHFVLFRDKINSMNVFEEGRKIRYGERFKKHGTNIDFVELVNNEIFVRTYERGVENETLSCGTGAVATAICVKIKTKSSINFFEMNTLGGKLKVELNEYEKHKFNDIYLSGQANLVFEGIIQNL